MFRAANSLLYLHLVVGLAVLGLWPAGGRGLRAEDLDATLELRTVSEVVQKVRPALATIRTEGRDGNERGIGTGFVVSADGLLATNLHVIGEGRPFSVEMADGRKLNVLAVEASDHSLDLAIVRVETDPEHPLAALELSPDKPAQGSAAIAMGNPWGLKDSVVNGVVSAFREIEGREMIQLAMPIEPGNSGGPVVNRFGQVIGVVNMKSAVEQNVGFAIQTKALRTVLEKPNPVRIERWTTLGAIDPRRWAPRFGADWRQRGGKILVSGSGQGFGGRALCLYEDPSPPSPFELAVSVRLDDESGAAGLVFASDGEHRHYGFYPSNGSLRLSCFRGPTVYSWQVLEETLSEHYRPGEWNRLRVRIEEDRLLCYVNDHLVIESRDRTYRTGKVGLAKFRQTEAEFKNFRVSKDVGAESIDPADAAKIEAAIAELPGIADLTPADIEPLQAAAASSTQLLTLRAQQIERQARQLAEKAEELRRIAADVHVRQVAEALAELSQQESVPLVRGALLIAQLEDPELDVENYVKVVERMAEEIRAELPEDADAGARLAGLNKYLFDENGFHGSRFEYYHRANSLLNRVLDDREGLPISLSVLYIDLGRHLDLNIEGVGLPGHFVVRFVPDEGDAYLVDVFDRGKRLTLQEAREMVRELRGPIEIDDYLAAAPSKEILARMLRNLLGVAERETDREAMLRYLEALVALEPDSAQFRGLRAVVRRETGRVAAAIADLDWFLEQQPAGIDLNEIERMRELFQRR